MNQASENLPLKKAREEYNLNRAFWKHDRRINLAKKEITNIKKIADMIQFNKNDQIFIDFTEFDNKNYHNGIKFINNIEN